MIGIVFFGAIGLWMVVAIVLGLQLPIWLKLKPLWSFLFVPLVLFAPVLDEVIAWPQMKMLCSNVGGYKFASGMDEKSAADRTVKFEIDTVPFSIFPSSFNVDRQKYIYIDSTYVVHRSLVGRIVGGISFARFS